MNFEVEKDNGFNIGVKWAGSSDDTIQNFILDECQGSLLREIPQLKFSVYTVNGDFNAIRKTLLSSGVVVAVTQDETVTPTSTVNDPEFGSMSYLEAINVPTAWNTTTGDGITIAIVDSGIDTTHPDLNDNLVAGFDFVDNDSDPTNSTCIHGTEVAGIAAAEGDNGIGVVGVAYGSKIMPIRVLDNSCNGSASIIAQGITYAVDNGADIINVSINANDETFIPAAVDYANEHGVLVVSATGNQNDSYINNMPPASPNALAVGGVSTSNVLYGNSNYGPFMITAPSQSIRTTYNVVNGSYGGFSLTSAASPIVAGVAALVKGAHPSYTPTQVCWAIKLSSLDLGSTGQDKTYGWGKVNASTALTYALPGILPPCGSNLEPPTYGWTHGLNSQSSSVNKIFSRNGKTAVTGNFIGTADFNPSNEVNNITSNNGGNSSSTFLLSMSNGGEPIFTNISNDTTGSSVVILPNNNIVSTTTVNIPNQYIRVNYWSADGSLNTSFTLNPGESSYATDVTSDDDGNVYISGIFRNTLDFDPSGATNSLTALGISGDAFLVSYTSDAAFRFVKQVGIESSQDIGTGVTADDTNVYLTGYTLDFEGVNRQGFVNAYNLLSGNLVWHKSIATGSQGYPYPQDIIVTPGGNILVTGYYSGTVDMDDSVNTNEISSVSGSKDIFLTSFSPSGDFGWTKSIGSADDDRGYSLDTLSDLNINIVGKFAGTVDFDPGEDFDNKTSLSSSGMFMSTYDSTGNYVETNTWGGASSSGIVSLFVDEFDTIHLSGSGYGTINFASSGVHDFKDDSSSFYSQIFSEVTKPTVVITTSSINSRNAGTQFQGSSTDADNNIAGVYYSVEPGMGSWTPCDADDGNMNEKTEEFTCSLGSNISDTIENIYVLSEDIVGNRTLQSAYGEVLVNTTIPSISLTALTPDPNNDNTPSFAGTATDAVGTVASVEYQMDGTGGSWTACTANTPPFDSASEAFTCTVAPALADGAHSIYVRATDSLANTTTAGSESTDAFIIDTTPPTGGSISIAGGAATTNTTAVTLTLSATDATQMILSEDSGFAGASWEAYSGSIAFTLSSGNGTKTIYAKYRDALQNTSVAVSDAISLDTVAPSAPGTPITTTPTNSTAQTWTWTAATDTISGVASYAWRVLTNLGNAVTSGTTTTTSVITNLTEGIYTFLIKAIDNANNSGNESSGTANITEPPAHTQAEMSDEVTIDLSPTALVNSETVGDSNIATLGKDTLTNLDNVEVGWDKPADTSNIHEYVVHYREIGSSAWKTESAGPDEDSISWDPGEGNWEWYLEIVYTDGSTSETSIYKFEVDQSSPENQLISIADEQMISLTDDQNNGLLLPFGSPLIFNFGNTDWDTIIEIWNWDKTIHYTTMVCGSGVCDHGDILTGPLTLVIYTVDEAGNESERREIKITPFGFVAGYVSNSSVPSEPTASVSFEPSTYAKASSFADAAADRSVDESGGRELTADNIGLAPGITPAVVDIPQPKLAPEPPRQNIFQRMWNSVFK